MPEYKQADRPLTITTPLGPDDLLANGFTGREGISQLFHFSLDLLAENKTDIAFDKLLGQKITIHLELPGGSKRHFNGLCVRFSQGDRDPADATFTTYRAEIVPDFWKLTRKSQSRIFQHMSVPDILKKVLVGFDVAFELQGTFHPRNFCVQYRESDFNFASRLMEEEGIYYYFKHSDGSHTGKYTLWDHTFELPHKHLDADMKIQESVSLGTASHKLKLGGNDAWELYDWPGEYAQRFDGVDKGGGDRPADIQKIFEDNKRTVAIRMQQEALSSLLARGKSNCRQMTSGHKFTLDKHFSGKGGPYVLTSVEHSAYGSRGAVVIQFRYENQFECIPLGLPFRPPQVTPKPVVQGSQTAVVVGPPGEEIFTDKYGRVKVQFHWDREGKNNPDSSCWLRVATPWAGKQWGVIHIPRVGQEVVVDFLEGDPDQPIIVGSVYNADMMPPYKLPANKTQSGVVSRSTLGGDPETFNEFCFEDKKGEELVYLRAEKDHIVAVEHDEYDWNGHDHWNTVDNDEKTEIGSNRTESVGANESISIGGNRTETVSKDETVTIKGKRTVSVMKDESLAVGQKRETGITANDTLTIGGSLVIAVANAITMTCGASSLEMKKDGTITLKGMDVTVQASMGLKLKGMDVSSEATKAHTTKGLTVSVEAQTSLSLKGLTASLEGQTTTDVKGLATTVTGNGTATLTAPLVRVEASGVAMISGALVKIN